MTRKSIPTGIPQLDALGRVTAKSLKSGHIQKTRDPKSFIFWEDGQYHVVGIFARVGYGEITNNRQQSVEVRVTAHTRCLKDAQRMLIGQTYLYTYRTWDSVLPAEALPAR